MNNITAVIVSYNRADLLRRAYESLRAVSDMPVIIIEGSDKDSECLEYSRSLVAHNTSILEAPGNIGHGKGMDLGIRQAKTEYVLLMDSDVEILKPCHDLMIEMMNPIDIVGKPCFGCGLVVPVDGNGTNISPEDPDAIDYLHPYFAVINCEIYCKVPGFVHHGAPCIRTMQYLHTFKKYSLIHWPELKEYVHHDGRGTRQLNPPEFLKGWE